MANTIQTKQPDKNQAVNKNNNSDDTVTSEMTKGLLSGQSTKKQKTLKDLFIDNLKDIYNAEKQLLKGLPEMAKAADNEELEDAFTDHYEQTQRHVQRLEKVFNYLGVEPGNETCEAMEGLIKENKEIIERYVSSPIRDSALIIGAQKVEHYEIAAYGSLCELADVLGYDRIHETLGRTLDEEEETDQLLSDIAQDVNDEAYESSEFNEEDEETLSLEEDEDEDEEGGFNEYRRRK